MTLEKNSSKGMLSILCTVYFKVDNNNNGIYLLYEDI